MSSKSQIIFNGRVIDNNDPRRLGRVRVYQFGTDTEGTAKAFDKNAFQDISPKKQWTDEDPFLFIPLFPLYFYQTPKNNEMVYLIYYDKNYKFKNQFYFQGSNTSPMLLGYEEYSAPKNYVLTNQLPKNNVPIIVSGTTVPSSVYGIFPEPGDNAVLGRGSADLIIKKDEVLLRAGKYEGVDMASYQLPKIKTQRAFIQLSNFITTLEKKPPTTLIGQEEQVFTIQYLVEWNILNPSNTSDAYTGSITLYQIKPDESTNTKNFKMTSDISQFTSAPIYNINFTAMKYNDVINLIQKFISGVNEGLISIVPYPSFKLNSSPFPFAIRPNKVSYKYIQDDNPATLLERITILQFIQDIKISGDDKTGCIIVYSKDSTLPIFKLFVANIENNEYTSDPITFNALGADKLYLLSHKTQIPKTDKIDLNNTLYGITQEKFQEIDGSTNSMVRGEQLISLLNLIVKFLISHTHAFPGLPPVPTAWDGTTTAQIGEALYNAPNTVLNQNIRIN